VLEVTLLDISATEAAREAESAASKLIAAPAGWPVL